VSAAIGNLKQKNIADTGCTTVSTGCPACMMQISDMLAREDKNIKVCHPMELYAKFLDNAPNCSGPSVFGGYSSSL
jgi:glycolate oxidase iron-sulfur subunit